MLKPSRVLAATDLSAPARQAAERAALVAKQIGATLQLIHVASIPALEKLRQLVAEEPEEVEQRTLETALHDVHELAAALQRRYGVAASVSVVPGSLLTQLASHVEAAGIDLIVLGARGAGSMRHMVLGATAERLLGWVSRPMLVVKQAVREPYRTVLVPVDFSPCSLPALRNAWAVAPGADIIVLHAFEVPFEGKLRMVDADDDTIREYRGATRREALQKLQELCDKAGVPTQNIRSMVHHGDAASSITAHEQQHRCDLIVMGKHGERTLGELLLGGVTKRVLAESRCDVLVSV